MEKSRQKHKKVKHRHPLHHVPVGALQLSNPWVLCVIIIRILSACAILIHPLWGIIIYWICDSKDNYVLTKFVGYTNGMYHQLDKPLDWVGLMCMYVVGYRQGLGMMLGILLFYRLLGYILYVITQKRWMFVLFPNFFEMVFVWFIVLPSAGISSLWLSAHMITGLSILFFVKMGIELFLHVYQPHRFMLLYKSHRWIPK